MFIFYCQFKFFGLVTLYVTDDIDNFNPCFYMLNLEDKINPGSNYRGTKRYYNYVFCRDNGKVWPPAPAPRLLG